MRRSGWWSGLVGLAESQSGLFTAAQAHQIGAGRAQLARLADAGTIDRLQHGIYQLAGTPVDEWTDLRAAWLSVCPERTAAERLNSNPEGVVSHRTAARFLDLGDLDAHRIEITIEQRRRSGNPDVLIHRGAVAPEEWIVHKGLPVTTPSATVRALARDGVDAGHLADITRDALLRYSTPSRALIEALSPAAKRYGHTGGESLFNDLLVQAGAPESAVTLVNVTKGNP